MRGSKLGGTLGPTELVGIPKFAPTSGGDPKTYPLITIMPYLCSVNCEWGRKLGVRGGTLASREVVGTPKIGPTGGRNPKTYSLISITPYLNLAPPHSPSPPEPPWASKNFLRPQGAFGSLWQPWVFSQTQRPCFPCSPSPLPPSLSPPFAP